MHNDSSLKYNRGVDRPHREEDVTRHVCQHSADAANRTGANRSAAVTQCGSAAASLPWLPPGEHLVLSGISWKQYVAISDALEERHIRVTYDRGTLEIMTHSRLHERIGALLNLLIVQLLLETRTRFDTGGSMTFRREDLERGFEPDNCYWIQHYAQVHGRDVLDFHTDPSPDLAFEVEVSRTVIARLGIYAALAVPEVWRCDGQTLSVLLRGEDGEYHESTEAWRFPSCPLAN